MPVVTVPSRPNGEPIAIAWSPGSSAFGVAELERLQAALDGARIDLQHGEVARRVLAHQLGRDRLGVDADPDLERVRALDHVVVGDDVAFVVVDEAGAGAGLAGLDEHDAGGDALVELGDVRGRAETGSSSDFAVGGDGGGAVDVEVVGAASSSITPARASTPTTRPTDNAPPKKVTRDRIARP